MNKESITKIIQWLYVNDGYYTNKNEWRVEFVRFLYQLVDESDLNDNQGNE